MKKKTSILFIRAEAALLKAIDVRVAKEQAEHPGRRVTRSDVVREILAREL